MSRCCINLSYNNETLVKYKTELDVWTYRLHQQCRIMVMVVEVSTTLQLTRQIHPNILLLSLFSVARSAPEQHFSTLKQEAEASYKASSQ